MDSVNISRVLLIEVTNIEAPPSPMTLADGRCYHCGHMAGNPCICESCENHGTCLNGTREHVCSDECTNLTDEALDRIQLAIDEGQA